MGDQALVIKRIRMAELPEYALTFTGTTPAPGAAPITRIRALSQVRNPCARPDDVALLVAYRDSRVGGYHGVMPGELVVDGRASRVHWSSAVYVAEADRGRGVGRQLIDAFKSLRKDLMVPGGMTDSAKGAYCSGGFRSMGNRVYYQLRAERIGRTAPFFKLLQPSGPAPGGAIAFPLSWLGRWVLELQKKHFYHRATAALSSSKTTIDWRPVDRIQRFTITAPKGRAIFLRGNDTVNWMLEHPWVYSWDKITPNDLRHEVRHYYFTKTRNLFRYAAFELYRDAENACRGFVVFSLSRTARRAQVKILDYAAKDPEVARGVCFLAMTAARQILADRIEIPPGLVSHFRDHSLLRPLLKEQALLSVGFPAGADSPLGASMGRVELGICDGDAAFT